MKITYSKHYREGTRCITTKEPYGDAPIKAGEKVTITRADDDGYPEIATDDGRECFTFVKWLKRIKPKKPALKVGDYVTSERSGVGEITGIMGPKAVVACEDGVEWVAPLEDLTLCDPPAAVPDGCPVDEQCHREMTAAGWEWGGSKYCHSDIAGLCPTGVVTLTKDISGMSGADCRTVNQGSRTLAAWREREADRCN